ncbi:MAG: TetR/AcrR family transcriptional regulator [Pseudomonadota bacterium]|nr:TetR/AcrR family transcriptional regulator [Pseudomonadota bacterium]
MTHSDRRAISDTREQVLRHAIALFAAGGYDSVSMRSIANLVGISAPALYHHFPDKQSLYLAAMAHAFADKAQGIRESVSTSGTPEQRIQRFVDRFTALMAEDVDFRMLLQRELLDGDESRLRLVAEQVFREPFVAISDLAKELAPDCDPHMLAISMIGLILFHFETEPVRRFLPGGQDAHDRPEVIAQHVKRLLSRTLGV